MNILFLLKSLETGGLEVVTAVLANEFVKRRHNVCVFSFLGGKNSIAKRFDKQIELYTRNDYSVNRNNIFILRNILIENKIDVIINQWGLPLIPIRTARKASRGLDVKIISVYHNAPSFNGRIQKLNIALTGCENPLKRILLKGMQWAFKTVTSRAMRYNYEQSDLFMVLSKSHINEFQKFTGLQNLSHLSVMTNPITVKNLGFKYQPEKKNKEVIYVGRIDFVQKRVNRVIDTWALLEERFPDWKLTIVGDGPGRMNIEMQVQEKGLKRVSFEGFQQPIEFYKRASVLMLTSDFEGFGLVIVEGMSFGVVPVVYGSYSAVYDIIEDGKDGIILPFDKEKGFDAKEMAERMAAVMSDPETLQTMAVQAVEKSTEYSIDKIVRQWEKVMGKLANKIKYE